MGCLDNHTPLTEHFFLSRAGDGRPRTRSFCQASTSLVDYSADCATITLLSGWQASGFDCDGGSGDGWLVFMGGDGAMWCG